MTQRAAPAIDEAALRRAAQQVITALAGPDARVRDDQLAAARVLVVQRRRALVVQATGWGKSAVYWIAAKAVRDAGSGPVLIVSPLLSLMRDQVAAAARAGLRALTLNSSNIDDWSALEADLLAGRVDVLLVSPERLANPRFAATVLTPLLPQLGLLVIDEAHCISSWGHDFRPDYQRIAQLLLANPDVPVLATTATANSRVTADVGAQLGEGTYVQRGQLARTSLHLCVVPDLDPVERYAWVDEALHVLSGSGIVYVLTVAEATRLNAFLLSRGHNTARYTGQMEDAERLVVESALKANELKAVVATSALGMGYDKPDLAFCLHVGSPPSPVDYYQQVGRAGRAVDFAVAALLPGPGDERLWEWFATTNIPRSDEAYAVLAQLAQSNGSLSVPALETATGIRRSRVELLVKVLAVDGAVQRTEDGWCTTSRPWTYDDQKYAALIAARRGEANLMRAYVAGSSCLETLLRRSLDDDVQPDARCERCSYCTGILPAELLASPGNTSVAAARTFLRGLDAVLQPRKMWASGMQDVRGRIGSDTRVDPGRALAFADDPAWPAVSELLSPSAPDVEAPDWLIEAAVAVLTRWSGSWQQRPQIVVPMPSTRRPRLITSLAQGVAAVGGLNLVHALESHGPPPPDGVAPSARARALQPRLRLRDDYRGRPAAVLLVDDWLRTGWTMTIAGGLLRAAGASAVMPFVVHQRP